MTENRSFAHCLAYQNKSAIKDKKTLVKKFTMTKGVKLFCDEKN